MCELDEWLPINNIEIEVISQTKIVTTKEKEIITVIKPNSWTKESWISCRFHASNDTEIWRLSEFTLKAPHIHNTAIGGIDITLRVIDLPGITILPSNEIGNPAADIINAIILKKNPTSPSKFSA
ncbi:MAG: hypothetical protein AAB501_02790 [Patescibacteria group bacterium]